MTNRIVSFIKDFYNFGQNVWEPNLDGLLKKNSLEFKDVDGLIERQVDYTEYWELSTKALSIITPSKWLKSQTDVVDKERLIEWVERIETLDESQRSMPKDGDPAYFMVRNDDCKTKYCAMGLIDPTIEPNRNETCNVGQWNVEYNDEGSIADVIPREIPLSMGIDITNPRMLPDVWELVNGYPVFMTERWMIDTHDELNPHGLPAWSGVALGRLIRRKYQERFGHELGKVES